MIVSLAYMYFSQTLQPGIHIGPVAPSRFSVELDQVGGRELVYPLFLQNVLANWRQSAAISQLFPT